MLKIFFNISRSLKSAPKTIFTYLLSLPVRYDESTKKILNPFMSPSPLGCMKISLYLHPEIATKPFCYSFASCNLQLRHFLAAALNIQLHLATTNVVCVTSLVRLNNFEANLMLLTSKHHYYWMCFELNGLTNRITTFGTD